ncbi:unnamed protein product [Prunus brigantina]
MEPSSYAGNEDPRTRFKHQSLMQGEIWCCIQFFFFFFVSFIRSGVFMISSLPIIRLFRVIFMSSHLRI